MTILYNPSVEYYPWYTLWKKLGAALGLYLVSVITYRLWFHPLRKYPGRRLAALTSWYQAYVDIVEDGAWVERLEEWHSQYGSSAHVELRL